MAVGHEKEPGVRTPHLLNWEYLTHNLGVCLNSVLQSDVPVGTAHTRILVCGCFSCSIGSPLACEQRISIPCVSLDEAIVLGGENIPVLAFHMGNVSRVAAAIEDSGFCAGRARRYVWLVCDIAS